MTVGGVFRFGVGEADGRRSSTWRVMAGPNKRDVYLSPRAAFSTFKLSLHQSGIWRFAYTEAGAKAQNLPPERNRLIQRYPLPNEVAPGWRMAASIMIPESSLSTRAKPEAGPIQWWPEPGVGFALVFNLWITASREADAAGLMISQVGCAGSFFLNGGGSLFVFVSEDDIADREAQIQRARVASYEQNKEHGLPTDDDFFSYGVAGNNLIDIPVLVDLGNLKHLLGPK